MNHCAIIGRLTKDPDMKTSGELTIARFTLAVDRPTKKDEADFISCVAFGKTAETIEKYLRKGSKIAVEGRIQTGSYEKDGRKIYTTDVIVERFDFCESKKTEGAPASAPEDVADFMNIPSDIDDEMPFGN